MDAAEKIAALSRRYRDYVAGVLSEIVKIPSLSGDEEKVIAKLGEFLSDAGFDEVRVDPLGNLIGRIGSGPHKLAFDAHIDVVDVGDPSQWDFDPFGGIITGDKVLGRGAADQKGGAASMVAAGKILKEIAYDGPFSLYFVFSIMEEDCDGMCWNFMIETGELVPDFAVLTEPTNLGVYRGHRGRMEIEVYFKGRSAHGAMPHLGDNAVYKAARAALEFDRLNREDLGYDEFLGKGTMVVSQIVSGAPSLCAVPDRCKIHIDRRLTWGETKESAIAEIKQIVGEDAEVVVPIYDKKSYRGVSHPQEKYFPTWKIEEDHPLVRSGVAAAEKVLGKVPAVGKWTFSTNGVAIAGKHKIPAIGFGPGNEIYAHAPNEFVPIDDLVVAAAFYALLPFELEKHL